MPVVSKYYFGIIIIYLYIIDTSGDASGPDDQYDQTETFFIKFSGANTKDLKIEHFDDMLQENNVN